MFVLFLLLTIYSINEIKQNILSILDPAIEPEKILEPPREQPFENPILPPKNPEPVEKPVEPKKPS